MPDKVHITNLLLDIQAVVCGLNAFILVFLPETVGKPMVETIKELENEKYEENDENENNEEENNNVKAEKEE